ncbi:hypothetical protein [Rossellomorea sp. y25]|uniref:hypothetical protein n=1 Tax=Rossellomorea sp. y25 TaxID=3118174 RepID=UPI0030DF247F
MRKVVSILLAGGLFMGGLLLVLNLKSNDQVTQTEQQQEEVVQDNLPKLHWYHEDKYPTVADLMRFDTFKGQFPLESTDTPLHNFND